MTSFAIGLYIKLVSKHSHSRARARAEIDNTELVSCVHTACGAIQLLNLHTTSFKFLSSINRRWQSIAPLLVRSAHVCFVTLSTPVASLLPPPVSVNGTIAHIPFTPTARGRSLAADPKLFFAMCGRSTSWIIRQSTRRCCYTVVTCVIPMHDALQRQ